MEDLWVNALTLCAANWLTYNEDRTRVELLETLMFLKGLLFIYVIIKIMKKKLEKFVLFLYKKYGITPDVLTYIRIFAAPWLALLVSKILSDKSLTLTLVTLVLYTLVVTTDFLDGILARAISKTPARNAFSIADAGGENHDHPQGGMLDRLSDKILIIFMLIPFGLNLFTFLIISAESILAFQALYSPGHKKQATSAGKIKMVLQVFLIPILILQAVTNFVPEMAVYIYIIITIIFTYVSVYSHYFYFKND